MRELEKEVLSRMGSPLRLSTRNKGRLVAKQDRVKQWLATEWTSPMPEESTDQSSNASNQQPFVLTLLRKLGRFFPHFCRFSDEWQGVLCSFGGSASLSCCRMIQRCLGLILFLMLKCYA